MINKEKATIRHLSMILLQLAVLWALCPPLCASASHTVPSFERIKLTEEFWSEGATFADINRDGYNDIVSGPYWYEGPDFRKRHEFRPASEVHFLEFLVPRKDKHPPEQLRYSDSFFVFIYDFNGDGWPDILSINAPGTEASWYENPGKEGLTAGRAWKKHVAFEVVGNESPTFCDLLGSGRPVLIFMTGGYLGYAVPDLEHPDRKWSFHAVSGKGEVPDNPYIHGLGVGDVNNDGRNDILAASGWWEQPTSLAGDPVWKFHRAQFGGSSQDLHRGGAQMYVYDVNGDGLPDVISSLDAHGYGLAWFEQLKRLSPGGDIRFRRHIIIDKRPSDSAFGVKFSQLHSVALVDMDGDGLKDIVTGKRFRAHGQYGDAEPDAPPVLYWFKLVRKAGGNIEFVPHLIDVNSGVGTQLVVGDVNGDGLPDIVVGNKRGTFVFLQEAKQFASARAETGEPKTTPNTHGAVTPAQLSGHPHDEAH